MNDDSLVRITSRSRKEQKPSAYHNIIEKYIEEDCCMSVVTNKGIESDERESNDEYSDIKLESIHKNYIHGINPSNDEEDSKTDNEDELSSDLNVEDTNNYISAYKSQLLFNDKILYEASRSCNPILERLNFLAIAESNLDEFIMTKYHKCKDSIYRRIKQQTTDIEILYGTLLNDLKETCDVEILKPSDIKADTDTYTKLEKKFMSDILPILQIFVVNDTTPNPHLVNGGMFMVVHYGDRPTKTAIMRIPSAIGRLIKVPGSTSRFVLLEDLIEEFMFVIFAESIKSAQLTRVLRKAESISYNSRSKTGERLDYIQSLGECLSNRSYNEIVFIDKGQTCTNPSISLKRVMMDIENSNDMYTEPSRVSVRKRKFVGGISFITELKKLIKTNKSMMFDKAIPRIPFEFEKKPIFDTISQGDVLIHYPYEDFELATLRFIQEAAKDKDVVSIKQTLYRVSTDSPIVKALREAAIDGKEVTVLFELKAKFDEKNNMICANALRSAGVNVIFGPLNLKTHAKLCAVIRKENGKIERYATVSTGNFNDITAKVYEDYALFTKDNKRSHIAYDIMMLFNHLGMGLNYNMPENILIAPYNMKPKFMELIDKCISSKGSITLKLNGLTEKDIIDKLYEASNAGVKIDIICRGMCCLKPGVQGLSENIQVKSIIGRYLEHSRVYKFDYTDEKGNIIEDIYIASADMMSRNLNNRIETAIPILDKRIRKEIKSELKSYQKDTVNSYIMNSDGTFTPPVHDRYSKDENAYDIHRAFIKKYRDAEESKFIIA